jgi:hypothetical protein
VKKTPLLLSSFFGSVSDALRVKKDQERGKEDIVILPLFAGGDVLSL